ncbi:MAG: GH92 family glycosyl hydrolase [Verrucomicrobiae bacterium]|nr:GH92 family glycosyl hydrolase [Verrucomicrobiae bacterium]
MKKTLFSLLLLTTLNLPGMGWASDNAAYVNPFIGTANNGHVFPGATMPFGLVQVSPDTGNIGWRYCSGYCYEDTNIIGFSHTHLSGTGWMDLGDIRLMPFTGQVRQEQYRSHFSHADEQSNPGYYSVLLPDYGVKAEMTATPRCAYHRYTFATNTANLLIDLQFGIVPDQKALDMHVIQTEVKVENPRTVSGSMVTKGWAGEKHVNFVIQFKQPIAEVTWLTPSNAMKNQKIVLTFQNNRQDMVLDAKVGISTVDIDGARRNLTTEIPGWHFERVKLAARKQWDRYLAAIQIDGSQMEKETFYTALYHTLVVPNNIADVDGRYRGVDNRVYVSKSKTYYSTFSLWDVHRAVNPLYTILWPERDREIVETMLAHFDASGYLPVWTLWGHENNCMIGNHAIPIIADAYLKGVCKNEIEHAFAAMKISSTVNHPKSQWDLYMTYGYLPADRVKEESVSRTLESAVDDWCVAQMAKLLGRKGDYALFQTRSQFYRNLYDASTGLMRGKTADGKWVTPFDQLKISHAGDVGGDYTEGNAWQYVWQVQQYPYGLIQLMGGDETFAAKLDKLFSMDSKVSGAVTLDVTGMIGQYDQGNEPVHHVAYLYDYAGKSWKTQERVHQIVTTLYDNTPAGLCGNDDCGQMSAWYLFSVLGFYPVNPAAGIYALGTPLLRKATMNLPNGRTFTIETVKQSTNDIYIDHIEFNGKPWFKTYLRNQDIINGGLFKCYMAAKPNFEFGQSAANRPPEE